MLTSLQDFITTAEQLNAELPGEIWWRGHASTTFVLQAGPLGRLQALFEINYSFRFLEAKVEVQPMPLK